MRPTLKDVAKLAGVNFTLVSKYLNGNPQGRMTAETRERIDRALRELNYHPSGTARNLKNGRSRTIGLLLGNLTNRYCAGFADRALRELRGRGYQLLIALADAGGGDEALQSLICRDVEGVICVFDSISDQNFLRNPPCQVITSDRDYATLSSINLDLGASLDAALLHLQELGSGSITGLFFADSLWDGAFRLACHRRELTASSFLLPFNENARLEKLRAICVDRPDAILTNGWQTATMLLELLDEEFPDYAPRIVFHANCVGPFLADRRIAGVIHSSSTLLIRDLADALISGIESGSLRPVRRTLPTRFIASGTGEFAALPHRRFELT